MRRTRTWTKVAALLAATALSAPATAGTLFFDFNQNFTGGAANASVFLFGNAGQTATVSTLSGFSTNVVLGANGFFNLPIDNSFQMSGTGVRTTGFTVQSANPIAGYFVNRQTASTDMTYLLDSNALGKQYVVASQGVGFGEGSQVSIRAVENNTNVTFTPRGGSPINVTLQAGESYKYAGGSTNLTGSLVSADRPVAVFGGHSCAQVPGGTTFCDTLIEQMIPTEKLSKEYLVTASRGAEIAPARSDLVRVIATADNTVVKVDGVAVATLNTGDTHEFSLPANSGAKIEADKPVMVAQYLKGGAGAATDPAMALVPGADTWLDAYRLSTPAGGQSFDINYASIVIGNGDLASLELNNTPVSTAGFTPIGTTGFSRGIVDLPLGLFELEANGKFLVMLGGSEAVDSYFTYGGSTFAPGISPPPPPPPPPIGVPEPASLGLLGAGLVGLGLIRRRRRIG